MATRKITVKLSDAVDQSMKRDLEVDIYIDEMGIYIRPHGTSDCFSAKDEGAPIMIEVSDGEPRILVWEDINQEDPTHKISLEKAKEKWRKNNDS